MDAPSKKRMRSCHDGKKRYTTLEAAKTAAAILVRRKAKAGSPIVSRVNAYPCSCGGFHIGKSRGGINWDLVSKVSKPVKLSELEAARKKVEGTDVKHPQDSRSLLGGP
jgi:hypothetical protein